MSRHLLAALLVMTTAVVASGQNLLRNGDLDLGGGGWNPVRPALATCAALRWDGAGFVEVSFSCASGVVDAGWKQDVPITSREWYRIAVRVAAAGLSGDGDVELTFRDAAGKTVWQTGVEAFAGTFEWEDMFWRVQAPAGSSRVEVFLGARHGQFGTARFDSVTIEPLGATGWRDLEVDLAGEAGTVRMLAATNRGPALINRSGTRIDYSERLRAAGIRMIRGHDVHIAFDSSVIFPDPGADPTLASSYRFGSTDELIAETHASGFEVFFRLGESYGGPRSPRMGNEKWAEVARHTVLHVNGTWAGGTRAGVRYWEIWNEANGPLFWNGTPESFYDLYVRTALAVKAADPSVRVGGPGLAGHTHEEWVRGLLRHVRAAAAPLDFFSWHVYHMGNPHTLARAQRQLRALLDAEGFAQTEILNTEWNLSGGSGCEATGCQLVIESAYNAAHAAAALAYLQDTDLTLAFRYRTDGTKMFGMCGDGIEEPEWSRSGLAFRLWAEFAATGVRLAASGGDREGFALVAGRSEDGSLVRVLIANQNAPEDGYTLQLRNLPEHFRWEVLEISDAYPCVVGDCEPHRVAAGTQSDLPGGMLTQSMAAPAVHLLRLEATSEPVRTPRRRLSGRH